MHIPSVLIFSAVLTRAKSVALNMTVPSLFRGMFIATSLWNRDTTTDRKKESEKVARANVQTHYL